MRKFLHPFIHRGIVLYFPASFKSHNESTIKALKLASNHDISYLGLFDIDEYVVLKDGESIIDILDSISGKQSIISIPLVYINGSNRDSFDNYSPLYEVCPMLSCGSLKRRVKSFVRPSNVTINSNDDDYIIQPNVDTFQGLSNGSRFGPSQFWTSSKSSYASYSGPVTYRFHLKQLEMYIAERSLGASKNSMKESDFTPLSEWVEGFNYLLVNFTCNWKQKDPSFAFKAFTEAKEWGSKIVRTMR
jgi:hypothetical protein